MYFQGGTLTGAKYGGLTPPDFTGLYAWYRATDGITFGAGSYVKSWNDLSGNGNHFEARTTAGVPVNSSGNLFNTSNGLGIKLAGTSGNPLVTDGDLFKVLVDGRPNTVIVVMKANNLLSSQNIIRSNPQTALNTVTLLLQVVSGVPRLVWQIRDNNNLIVNSQQNIPTLGANAGTVFSTINYGYNNGVTNPFQSYFNNELVLSSPYTSTPSYVSGNAFAYLPSASIFMYEMIFIDNTGKTEARILDEHYRLHTEYINLRYPNLYIS